jgi:hypothetical protein
MGVGEDKRAAVVRAPGQGELAGGEPEHAFIVIGPPCDKRSQAYTRLRVFGCEHANMRAEA